MDIEEVEKRSRIVPWSRAEIEWARSGRRGDAVTLLPETGDLVAFRPDEWAEPVPAIVMGIQPLDDASDPHVMVPQLDEWGSVVLLEGRPIMLQQHDPWPLVWLRVTYPDGRVEHTHTREARLRGSPGWLPQDWRSRRRPLPAGFDALLEREDKTDKKDRA